MGQEFDENEAAKEGGAHAKALFPDANQMKDDLRRQMAKPEYDVSQFYYTTGIWQWIARHPRFEKLTLLVIGLNAMWIAVDTDWNDSSVLLQAAPIFQTAEHVFCIYFSFEWTMRFMAFRRKLDGRKDFWFVFDSALVLTMVLETWVMTSIMLMLDLPGGGLGGTSLLRVARLLRLTRMARMARLLRAMPELLILIKGMAAAMRSVMFTLGLLAVIIYVFAIAFTQLCDGTECSREFKSVGHSMHYLLVKGALMDGIGDVQKLLEPQSYLLLLIFYIFVLLAALTVMNMLIGVICEVVSAVAATEQERMTVSYVKDKIAELIRDQNKDNDDQISRQEFKDMFSNTKAMGILQDVGVDVIGLVDFADTIFDDACEANEDGEDKLSFEDFMGLILDLRGSNNATVKDVVDLRKHINLRIENFETKLLELPHFAMARANSKYRSQGSSGSVSSQKSKGSVPPQDPVKVLRQLVDQSLQDFATFHQKELSDLKEQTRRLKAALTDHGGDVMLATGSLCSRSLSTNSICVEDKPQTNKLKDMSMEDRISKLTSKEPLQDAFAEMTYDTGCKVHETASPRDRNLGKVPNKDAGTNGTHPMDKNCRVSSLSTCATSSSPMRQESWQVNALSTLSTCATSSSLMRQERSAQEPKRLATHVL